MFVCSQRRKGGSGYFGGDPHGRFGHLTSPVGERDSAAAPVLRIIQGRNETAQVQAINNAFDRRGVKMIRRPR